MESRNSAREFNAPVRAELSCGSSSKLSLLTIEFGSTNTNSDLNAFDLRQLEEVDVVDVWIRDRKLRLCQVRNCKFMCELWVFYNFITIYVNYLGA